MPIPKFFQEKALFAMDEKQQHQISKNIIFLKVSKES